MMLVGKSYKKKYWETQGYITGAPLYFLGRINEGLGYVKYVVDI